MEDVLPIAPVEEGFLAYVKDGENYTLALLDGDGNIIDHNPEYDFPKHISSREELTYILDARSIEVSGGRAIKIKEDWMRIDSDTGMKIAGRITKNFHPENGGYYAGIENHYIWIPENNYGYTLVGEVFMALEINLLQAILENGKAKYISRPGETMGEVNGRHVKISEDLKELHVGKHVFPTLPEIIPEAITNPENLASKWCSFKEGNKTTHFAPCDNLTGDHTVDEKYTADLPEKLWKIMREVYFGTIMKRADKSEGLVSTLFFPPDFDGIEWSGEKLVAEYNGTPLYLDKPEDLWIASHAISAAGPSLPLVHPKEGYMKNNELWLVGEISNKTVKIPVTAVSGLWNAAASAALLGKEPFDLSNIPCNELEYVSGIVKRSPFSPGAYTFKCKETGKEYTISF